MRTGRRDLKKQRLQRISAVDPAVQVKGLCYLLPRHKLVRMIAGAGVGIAGGGAAMLRTRRRDISIKPNRKLDRKSSRGMLYENEELRLRTININAEVEQGARVRNICFSESWLPPKNLVLARLAEE